MGDECMNEWTGTPCVVRVEVKAPLSEDPKNEYLQHRPEAQRSYTVDDAIERIGFGWFHVLLTLVCGVVWFADATQFMLMSTLCFIVKCQWKLSSAEEAVVTSVLFLGAMIGSLFWGLLGDAIGRKKVIFVMALMSLTVGILCAQKLTPGDDKIPGYPWILLCRFVYGFSSACIPQVTTYYIEFLPRRARAVCSVLVSLFWSLGTMFSAGLGAIIMGETSLGWHWYLGLSASVMVLPIVSIPFFPESARFYVVKSEHEKARKVLARIAWFNCKSLPEGRVVSQEVRYGNDRNNNVDIGGDSRDEYQPLLINATKNSDIIVAERKTLYKKFVHKFSLFFVKSRWRVTVLLFFIWTCTAILYYGNVLLASTIIIGDGSYCSGGGASGDPHQYTNTSTGNGTCDDTDQVSVDQYLNIMWTAAAEIPAIFITIIIIEVIGRKLTLTVNYTMLLGGLCVLFLCPSNVLLTVLLCWIRGVSDGVLRALYVYTNEVYPTTIRGFAVGMFNSVSRIGASVTPYLAQVLFEASGYATIGVFAGLSLFLIVVSFLLPVETKGKALKDDR